jgi:hypothetical protein
MAEEREFDFTVQATLTATFKAESEAAAREQFAGFLAGVNADDYIQAGGRQFYVSIEEGAKPDITEVCTTHHSEMNLGYCVQCRKEKRKPGAGSAMKRSRP